jgi:trimeric autotransporter adhesin
MRSTRTALAAVVLLSSAASAQQYVISTYAGGAPPLAAPLQGTSVSIGAPISVATDEKGNVYFASPDLNAVFKLDPGGLLTGVAGSSKLGYAGDGGPATAASMNLMFGNASAPSSGLAVDRAGNLFIADTSNHCVRRVSPDGIIVTVAGKGVAGFSGDGGPAVDAKLAYPWGVAVDPEGNLFIMDAFNYRVRKVSTSGIITTMASVVGWAVAVDRAGTVFVTYPGGGTSEISANGTVTTVASIGGWGLAVDSSGNLFVADGNASVQKVSPNGTVTIMAGNGKAGYSGDGGPASSAQFSNPPGVAVDSNGNLFIADRLNYRIRKVSTSGVVTTVAGNGTGRLFFDCSSSHDAAPAAYTGPATSAQLSYPLGVAVDRDGNLFIADALENRIRKVSASGIITTVAGTGSCGGISGDAGPASDAQLWDPVAVAVDNTGNLFIAESGNNRIRRVSPDGIITTVAGDGTRGFSGDGGPATAAQLRIDCDNTICGGVAVDSHGNVIFSDGGNNRVRRISVDGIITTVAGNGSYGFSGDGGQATSTSVTIPRGLAVDSADNLFIAEEARIRKVLPDGTITTVAGGIPFGVARGFSGDGGLATSARLSWPVGVAVDRAGNLLIADPGFNFEVGDAGDDPSVDQRVRKVSPDGIITTIAGNGLHEFAGDGGPAATAAFNGAIGVAVDSAGNVFVADALNGVIRILRPETSSVLIGAVVDAASQHADPVSPGKIVVVYGAGLGPSQLIQNQPKNGQVSTELSGTTVSFDNFAAPILYSSATQVAAVVPYAVSGSAARVTVTYQGQVSADFTVPVTTTAPNVFTSNQAGWGQAAAINAVDGMVNTPVNPVQIGGYISLYATGEGQTLPAGVDGKLAASGPAHPVLPVSVTVGGIQAQVQYAGSVPGQVAGLSQVNVQIPGGVQPGGYVPVILQVGDRTSGTAVWIAVRN